MCIRDSDKRAQSIIDDHLRGYKLDLADQLRIVERDAFARVERYIVGKAANGGPKRLAKGSVITKEYLDGIDAHHWFDIRMADDEVAQPVSYTHLDVYKRQDQPTIRNYPQTTRLGSRPRWLDTRTRWF